MCRVIALSRSLSWSRLAIVAAVALATGACSSNTSRFSDDGYTSSTRPKSEVANSVNTQPAPAINSATLPPPPSTQAPQVPPAAPTAAAPALSSPQPALRAVENPATVPTTASASKATYVVVAGDTLHKVARKHQVSLKDLAAANKLERHATIKLGSQLVIPGASVQPAAQKPPAVAKPIATNSSRASNTQNADQPAVGVIRTTQAPETPVENKVAAAALTFRRPVNGRVVSGFGPKPSGTENLGVNFAVPEGTEIKAAADGVVAYASSELKSFGNLVMIRHAGGYVTTYAHASEILVKRDDVVKRGQVIAKSGQTGNVSSPQLHFEIRKGATPVDPMPYLERGP